MHTLLYTQVIRPTSYNDHFHGLYKRQSTRRTRVTHLPRVYAANILLWRTLRCTRSMCVKPRVSGLREYYGSYGREGGYEIGNRLGARRPPSRESSQFGCVYSSLSSCRLRGCSKDTVGCARNSGKAIFLSLRGCNVLSRVASPVYPIALLT